MDDNKLFTKNGKELETLIQAVMIFSQDIGMEFSIEKCDRRYRTTKLRQNRNAQRNEKLQILGNIGSRHH